jgi:hypothetical protein
MSEKENTTASIAVFKNNIKNGLCPFCRERMVYYDGALGYEACRCYSCKLSIDNSGIHLDDF